MSQSKKRNSSRKGEYGYLAAEKKRRILITAILFSVPLLIFFSDCTPHSFYDFSNL